LFAALNYRAKLTVCVVVLFALAGVYGGGEPVDAAFFPNTHVESVRLLNPGMWTDAHHASVQTVKLPSVVQRLCRSKSIDLLHLVRVCFVLRA
jgi:hypothetical protein